jgi:predicted HicB family RNase H-like nuclease
MSEMEIMAKSQESDPVDDPSGRFILRIPKGLHKDLSEVAKAEGASLNMFCTIVLAKAVENHRKKR